MKLIVQIPCFNEEATLPETVRDIPRAIDGVDEVEILVIDDGSSDRTVEVAQEIGVDHILRLRQNKGLALAFRSGIDECLRLGADIIVNTDADNQYSGASIPLLIRPILHGEAEIVVGDRQSLHNPHFTLVKRLLQVFGSAVVRQLSGLRIPDAVSGFRAISKSAALRLNIVSSFSYTIEMLIQAGRKKIAVLSVPVDTNPKTRESRLFRSIPGFIWQSTITMVRMYAMYRPLKVFVSIGILLCLIGLTPMLRFFVFFLQGQGDGHIQSLIIGGVLLVVGFMTFLIGLLADLINFNRQLVEMTLERVRRLELEDRNMADPGNQEAALRSAPVGTQKHRNNGANKG